MDTMIRINVSILIVLGCFFIPYGLFSSLELAIIIGVISLFAAAIWISEADDFPVNIRNKEKKFKPYK